MVKKINDAYGFMGASQMAVVVKNLSTNAGDVKRLRSGVSSLGQEDLLEEGMQPTPIFLPGESHG